MAITYLRVRFTEAGAGRGLEILQQALIDTRAFEGCLSAQPFVDPDDPTGVVVREEWASRDREQAYLAFRSSPEGAIDGLAEVTAEAPAREHVEG